MVDDAIAQLYRVPPAEFTALRTRLAAQAKQDGDPEAAKQISAQRKPSTSAWIVNALVQGHADVRERIVRLGDELRSAQGALDADRLRELSTERRALVDELARQAFREVKLAGPSAALRDDVTATLQAAIADPDVAARLGRLHRAERWSGFGEVVDVAPPKLRVVHGGKGSTHRDGRSTPSAAGQGSDSTESAHSATTRVDPVAEAREQLDTAVATVAAAEEAKAQADEDLDDRHAEYMSARMKRDEARRRLTEAEERVTAAEQALEAAKRASAEADDLVKEARKQQRARRAALDEARRRR